MIDRRVDVGPDDVIEPDVMGADDAEIVGATIWGAPGVAYEDRQDLTFAEWARTKGT